MTQPPQQPSGQGQPSYQGLGAYPGGPQKKRNTGRMVAIIAIVALVLAGGGVATYFLTKSDDGPGHSASSDRSNGDAGKDTGSDETSGGSSDDASSDRDQDQGKNDSDASNGPDDVRDDYMAAYENNDFSDVVDSSCKAYKKKFGTDTSDLENKLKDYDISATPDGDVDVDSDNPDTATAKIDLTLTGPDDSQDAKILIKIVEENGKWRFCGEDEA
jgi:hypothetical protein